MDSIQNAAREIQETYFGFFDTHVKENVAAIIRKHLSPETSAWVKVTERLPEPYRAVLIAIECEGTRLTRVDEWNGKTWRAYFASNVTHWQPLPAPPVDEES